MNTALNNLIKIEAKAWKVMMNGTEADARTVYGEEGKNYIAWCAAADEVRALRQKLAA
jgi:hypothetical protein